MGIIHTAKKYIVPELNKKYVNLKQEEIARVEGKYRSLTKKEEIDVRIYFFLIFKLLTKYIITDSRNG